MYITRTVTARQLAELVAKGHRVTQLVGEFRTRDLDSTYTLGNGKIYVRWADSGFAEHDPNHRITLVNWPATDEMHEAEAAAEFAAERAAERYWEEGPNGPEDDPRERELWALEDMRRGC